MKCHKQGGLEDRAVDPEAQMSESPQENEVQSAHDRLCGGVASHDVIALTGSISVLYPCQNLSLCTL